MRPPGEDRLDPIPVPAEWQAAARFARCHLATRLGLSESRVAVTRVEPREWSDASLGAPVEGALYAQVVTRGLAVWLLAQGRTYRYHCDITSAVCVPAGEQPTGRQ
jgi:hypothetical protein